MYVCIYNITQLTKLPPLTNAALSLGGQYFLR